jgi:hypothetical protein
VCSPHKAFLLPALVSTGFLGCFIDASERDLPNRLMVSGESMSISVSACRYRASTQGFLYFGLEAGGECWAGNAFGRYGQASSGACWKTCADGSSCGGDWLLSVYITKPLQSAWVKQPTESNTAYIGCFIDAVSDRDLPYTLSISNTMTPSACAALAKAQGYKFYGIQIASECFAGNSFGRHGSASSSDCSMKCPDGSQCGASVRNSIYAVNNPLFNTNRVLTTSTPPSEASTGYLGCFIDSATRDLPNNLLISSNIIKLSDCRAQALAQNYTYFGIQMANECRGSNSYGSYGQDVDSACVVNCVEGMSCGGPWRNSVYKTTPDPIVLAQSLAFPSYTMGYIGCFREAYSKEFTHYLGKYTGNYMTNDATLFSCRARALDAGYAYIGLQNGGECWAGNSYGMYGRDTSSACSYACADGAECGSGKHNSVYTTNPMFGSALAYSQEMLFNSSTQVSNAGTGYIGCFTDSYSRDLSNLLGEGFTVSECRSAAADKQYKYFALQKGGECWADDSYGHFGRALESSCLWLCTDGFVCGGLLMNSVYVTDPLSVDNLQTFTSLSAYGECPMN